MIYTFRFSILGENCDGYDAHVLLQLEAQLSGEAKHRLETELEAQLSGEAEHRLETEYKYKNIIENEKPDILIKLHGHKSSLLPQGAHLPTRY
ncbi:unnamed protein product [Prunus armeniaca]|uniref:Uncharacterized protein n=1 Tax=Prunus armeniaca TaxID=36596 RepID=A0A6J5WNJ4_PRUAR|nr:unnamed protein product [Prunus armeniaca]